MIIPVRKDRGTNCNQFVRSDGSSRRQRTDPGNRASGRDKCRPRLRYLDYRLPRDTRLRRENIPVNDHVRTVLARDYL